MPAELGPAFKSHRCTLLISAPTDGAVYRCFQSIARQWKQQLTAERLLIEGDVQMTSGLTCPSSPAGVGKILSANLNVIATIQLDFGGLSISYVRSEAVHPNRKSYFDEIRLALDGFSTLSQTEIGQLILLLCTCLGVSAASGSEAFHEFTDGLPIRVRYLQGRGSEEVRK